MQVNNESNIIRSTVHVCDLKHGDTVEVNGVLYTVSGNDLRYGFCGHTYKGDPHPRGITKVVFKVPTAFGFRYEGL